MIFKKMAVHRIQAHTYYGFMPDKDVHHLDENKLNNALSNLKYVTRSEHAHIHGLTRPRTGAFKEKVSNSIKHVWEERREYLLSKVTRKGCHWYNNGIENKCQNECPRRRLG